MKKATSLLVSAAVTLCAAVGSAHAVGTIDWLQMNPVPFGNTVPNNTNYNLPGVGLVNITYSMPTTNSNGRVQNPVLTSGNVGGYNWTNYEAFGTTNLVPGSTPINNAVVRVTYTFPATQSPNTIYLGIIGLGQTSSFGGGASTATVFENGTFLGDWNPGSAYGPTQFTPGNPFSLQNSLTGPGGIDPWWNSALGVVQINNSLNSITVIFNNISGDGVGVNIGYLAPSPGAAGLFALSGLLAARRRR